MVLEVENKTVIELRESQPWSYLFKVGHEYSGDLISGLVWILNGRKEVGLQMVWIPKGIWNLEAQPFEIQTNGLHFVRQKHLKFGQKCPDLEWSGFQMVGTIAISIAKP